jgi:predicted RecB family endonuclease
MLGEIAFHSLDHAGKDLDQVLSIVSVRNRTPDDLLDAIRAGRLYAVERRKKELALRLGTFRVECDGGRRSASIGEILDPEGHRDLVIRASVSTTDRQAHRITATIIRSGETLAQLSGTTPLTIDMPDKTAPASRWLAYRLVIEGEGELVSNPVFVGPMPSDQPATAVTREARS